MKLSPLAAQALFFAAVCAAALAQIGILWSTLGSLRSQGTADATNSPTPVMTGGKNAAPTTATADNGHSAHRVRPAIEVLWAVLPIVALVILFLATWHALPAHA